jgi:hypothetical protein
LFLYDGGPKWCYFHRLYKKVTQNHFYDFFLYAKDVPFHMERRSLVAFEKHFGSL